MKPEGNQSPMTPQLLRRVELRNFKSAAHVAVDLKPLTAVVGANSSGKSTLLQAVLLASQAIKQGSLGTEFPLNGEFVKLGTFDETCNFAAADLDPTVEIGFQVQADPGVGTFRSSTASLVARRMTRFGIGRSQLVNWTVRLGAGDGADTGFAVLQSLELEVAERRRARELGVESEFARRLSLDVAALGGAGADSLVSLGLVPADGRVTDWGGAGSPDAPDDRDLGGVDRVHALRLSSGVPSEVFSRLDRLSLYVRIWWDFAHGTLGLFDLLDERKKAVADAESEGRSLPGGTPKAAVDHVVSVIESFEERTGLPQPGRAESPDDVRVADRGLLEMVVNGKLRELPLGKRKRLAASLIGLSEQELVEKVRRKMKAVSGDDDIYCSPGHSARSLAVAALAVETGLGRSVRYLGPIREAPHVLYDPGPSKRDLGTRGEYAAAVLHAQAGSIVSCPSPDGTVEERVLGDALNEWLEYFGMASEARSQDRGRIGIGLTVTPVGGSRPVDLTSVGVGVSQLLPILLLCLLAEPGTLVILEQPELHLHPALEQRLADFLLACVRTGRQLLIETHSEHLVTRLRRRVVEDPSDATQDLVGLLFAEQSGGVTTYRESSINPLGGLDEDWPDGFLDLGAREASTLLRVSLEKRKRQRDS